MTPALPIWLQWVQALGVPALAVAGAFIAYQQMRIARSQARTAFVRAQHDMFPKRFEVYEAASTFLATIVSHGKVSQDDFHRVYKFTNAARFLFPPNVSVYLDKLGERASSWHATRSEMAAARQTGRTDAGLIEKEKEQHLWLLDQLEELAKVFGPYLRIDPLTQ